MSALPPRSWLYVPAHDGRKIARAAAGEADAVILDLEDGTPPDLKHQARERVAQELEDTDFGGSLRFVRVNALGSAHWNHDVADTLPARPDGYVIPKATPEAVWRTGQLVQRLADDDSPLPALAPIVTEDVRGFFAAGDALVADALVAYAFWGSEDLSADLGAWRVKGEDGQMLDVFRVVRSLALLHAVHNRRHAVDTPFLGLGDRDGLAAEAREAAAMGFSGKQAIHPDHVAVINEMFVPAGPELQEARELVGAFADGAPAVVRVQEQMADAPHLARARRMLALAEVSDGQEEREGAS